MVVRVGSRVRWAAMVADQTRIRRSLAILESTGQYVDPEMLVLEPVATAGTATATPTCYSVFSVLFGRMLGHTDATAGTAVPTKEGGVAAAPKKKANRLEQANEALQARVDTLHERAATQRAAATAAFKSGDKRVAMMTLKRAKATEAAAESAGKAQMALETQIDVMEQASVTAQVSTALSSAVKKSQKAGRGLLQKAEKAADGASEVMDLSQDVASTLAEMGPSGQEDDDELMAELEAMMGEDNAPPAVAPVAAKAPIPTVSAAVLAQMPKVPQRPVYNRLTVPVPAGSVLLGA